MRELSRLAEELLASQEGLAPGCYVNLIGPRH
jgi:hypothetical protein